MGSIKHRKSIRKRIVDTTKEYSSATTIHGIAYLFDGHVSILERYFWAVVVCMAIYLATYQVSNLYNDWQDDPVVTTLETVALPIEDIEFPAVTICPQGSRQEIVDLVLFRQLTEYIGKSRNNLTTFTEEEMAEQAVAFLNDVYPGATGKPTLVTKLLASDNPQSAIENEAVLQLEEKCDPSINADITKALNKYLNNDTCPKGFAIAQGSNYCLHAGSRQMSYNEASKYCNEQSGSRLFFLETYDELHGLSNFLNSIGNIGFQVDYQ